MCPRGLPIILAVICGLSAVNAVQAGTIFPKRQARSVQISCNDGGTPASDKAAAAAFEPFTKTVTFARGAGFDVDRVQASQDSQINAETITATGGVVVSLGLGFLADAKGQSDFSATFRVLQPVTYSVSGSILWDELLPDATSESPSVKLTGAQDVIYQSDPALPGATPIDLTTNGVLQPGEYTIEAHASSLIPSGGGGATKNYSLTFGVVPNGPVGLGFGNVYQLSGAMLGAISKGGNITPIPVTPRELVNLALNLPSTTAPKTQSLALVSDRLDRSLRLAVWDSKTGSVVVELGPIVLQPGLAQGNSTLSIGDWSVTKTGRFLDTLAGADSVLTIVSRATVDPGAGSFVSRLIAAPTVGQINFLDDGGVARTAIITEGALFTGRKLGTTP